MWVACVGTYLGGARLVGRAALQVGQDAGEGVDLSVQAGAPLLQGLPRAADLPANVTQRGEPNDQRRHAAPRSRRPRVKGR